MEREITHFSHDHPLILKVEEHKIDDGTNQSVEIISCGGCSEPILGPFYSCGECGYYLHKVCAELPNEMNHPKHPEHPLKLLSKPPSSYYQCICDMCGMLCDLFVYHCSICKFDVDMICASASLVIEDKCHEHPLIPLQLPISFPCHICRIEEKGFSYKCVNCPFWVHQNCTISLPGTVNHSYHDHHLTLLQHVSREYRRFSRKCDICHDRLFSFHCVYYCERCLFFAHVNCARSEETPQLPGSRDPNFEINQDFHPHGQCLALLPIQQRPTDLISWFAENYSDRDVITNLILGFPENYVDRDINIKKEIKFFDHECPLFLDDDQASEEICVACALPISTPSYSCIDCDYFIHKCCTELPDQILHPAHPQHQISLYPGNWFFWCHCCYQPSNGFSYKCLQCGDFRIDIKCVSLLRLVKHVAHKHPLIPKFISSDTCSACGKKSSSKWILKCNTCSFSLCFECAMAPPMMKHRWDEHPFVLTYSPPENHYKEYICDLCEEDLNPKYWFYHCRLCDQYTHMSCMLVRGADSNINYGMCYKFEVHEHDLILVSCTEDCSLCYKCRLPMKTGYSVGLECVPCDFKMHLLCALNIRICLPN